MKTAPLFASFIGMLAKRHSQKARKRSTQSINIEALEERLVPSSTSLASLTVISPPTKGTGAEGAITYNASTRTVSVAGSNTHGDNILITVGTNGTSTTTDDMLNIQLRNAGSTSSQFPLSSVDKLFVQGFGGDDVIDNRSFVKMTANGDAGNDVLLGGFANDSLIGSEGSDYIDGRRGNDTIWGMDGTDALFGDDGNDLILGGSAVDYIFGGNGDDDLYGEGDNDKLYGEAGSDKLTDSAVGTVMYTDYGPATTISASGYQGFDWFDRNLTDADVRSLTRLQYRDSVLQRNDALQIYTYVASDNLVSSSEFADLRTLTSTVINASADVKFYMNRIAYGDRANQWYKGTTLGNLISGTSGAHLNALVDKWMRGGDLPAMPDARVDGYSYVSGSLFVNGADYQDVNQRNVGDCYLLAALGEIALHRSSIIQNMFIDNGDGTFGVRFLKNGVSQFVTVNRYLPTYKSFAVGAGWGGGRFDGQYNELWVALAEKAYAQLNESGWIGQDGTNSYDGISGGYSANVFKQVAGTSTIQASLSKSGIIAAYNAGKAITLDSKVAGVASNVVENHVYMLIGYDASKDKFRLYNPWGIGAPLPVELELSYSELVASFIRTTSTVL